MRKLLLSAIAVAATVATLPAQILHSSEPMPSFEVATIKLRPPFTLKLPGAGPAPASVGGAGSGEKVVTQMMFTGPAPKQPATPSEMVSLHVTSNMLIAMAYNLPLPTEGRIIGGPDWMKTDSYDIQAKIDDALFQAIQKMPPDQSKQQRELMEQSLLADRFKLKVHFETRDMPVYALVAAKGGPKLTPSKEGEAESIFVTGGAEGSELKATAAKLDNLARLLQMQPDAAGRMLVNQTGLTGTYDFTLNWSRDPSAGADSGLPATSETPSFFTALQEQLGLRMVPTKASMEVVVIDHIEHPTEN